MIAWPLAIIGLLVGAVFAYGASTAFLESTANRTDSVARQYLQVDAAKLVGCAAVAWAPSVWFFLKGRRIRSSRRDLLE